MDIEKNERSMKMDRDEYLFFREIKNKLDLNINPGSSINYPDGSSKYIFRLPEQMELLKETKYFCPETKLLHFTSLEASLSIINDSSIRMYNLWNSSDEQEYTHAAEIFDRIYEIIGQKGETRIKLAKSHSFIHFFIYQL